MTFFKVLVVQLLFIIACQCIAICNRSKRSTEAQRNPIPYWNTTTISPYVNSTSKTKVELKVYYETLCQASMDFFVSQLNPAVKRLGSHLEVHLIPYGHAKTYSSRAQYSFTCQHGPPECYCNMVHACAIDVIRNNTHAIQFTSCLMQYNAYSDYKYFVSVITWCGYTENVRIHDIWLCVNSRRGFNLLKEYGDETHALSPRYVPYLTIDGSIEHQNEATSNLFATVCNMLSPKPQACLTHR